MHTEKRHFAVFVTTFPAKKMCLSSLKRQNIKSMRSHGVKESTETKFCFVLIKHVVHGVIINRRCALTESRSQITLSI